MTIFLGENGTGKSTLVDGIAVATNVSRAANARCKPSRTPGPPNCARGTNGGSNGAKKEMGNSGKGYPRSIDPDGHLRRRNDVAETNQTYFCQPVQPEGS
jgi:hypothetical protein